MEHNEPLQFGHDPDGSSKRRISSILKAPRTSLKAFGTDQDEHQEETRPSEKRRISRRVSFATTNNVHVFSKDIKTESPILGPICNSTAVAGVSDGQAKTMQHFDGTESQNITDLDTTLSVPFHISKLNKESFFSDPVLQDECMDKTVLLGEDTGYMDMTHSHTITIDKEHDINSEFSFDVLENVTGLHNLKNQNGTPCKTTAHVEKDAVHSEFSAFLASISKPGVHNITPLTRKTDRFGWEDTTKVKMDKENVLPTRFTKQAAHYSVNPQSKVLQPRISTASFLEQDHMDMTKCHTVVIDRREVSQYDAYSVNGNHRSTGLITQSFSNNSDDMEITQSQTANINLQTMEDVNCSLPMNVGFNGSNLISDDVREIVVTQVPDGFLQEPEQKVLKDKALTAFPKILSGNGHISDRNTADHFQSNLLIATVPDSDDMEITQSQTVVLETKCGGEPFGKSRKVSYIVSPLSSRRGSKRSEAPAEDTVFPNEQSAFMELTCQTNLSVMIMSPGPDDMELTGCNYVAIGSQNSLTASGVMSRTHTSLVLPPSICAETKTVDCIQSDISVPHVTDDMEMTQCQTIMLESKCGEHTPFGKSRKSLMATSCDMSSDIGSKKDMKMAHELSGHTALNRYASSELPECMEIHKTNAFGISAVQDDMELTGCNTVTTHTFAGLDEDQMEMPEVVNEKPERVIPSQITKCTFPAMAVDSYKDIHNEPYLAYKDLIKSQADTNSCEVLCLSNVRERSPLHLIAKNVDSSEKDCAMELTGAFTMPLEKKYVVDFKQGDSAKENTETLSGTTVQTTIKEGDHVLPINEKIEQSVKSRDFSTKSELVKKDQLNSAKSRRRSLADLQEKLQTIAHSINEPNGLLIGSCTAPVGNFTVSKICPIDERSKIPSSTDPLSEMPILKNVSSANTEHTAPFNLKNFLTARLSLGGVTPKLPSRTKPERSPNQTEPLNSNIFQNLHLETQQDSKMQNSSCVISMIDNEVLPEEDLSDTVVSYLSNKKDGQDNSTLTPLDEVATEDDVNISQPEKMACNIYDAGDMKRKGSSETGDNNSAALAVLNVSSLTSKVIDDTCSTTSSTNIKCEGIAESSLRNSQFDSQIGGTVDLEFDFGKILEDGSITVNEFLSHFGANTVIHKSRPSVLPDNFRVAQTHLLEDLLREKYIYHSKQSLYETDCQKLSEMAEGFETQKAAQYKPLREINETLLQDMCSFSNAQLQRLGAKLKERRVYFRKRSKELSHEMKKVLYSELLKAIQDSKQNLVTKIRDTNEMLKDLNGCVNDLESEMAAVNSMLIGDEHCLISQAESALKSQRQDLDALNSEVAETEKQICDQEHQRMALVDTQEKLQDEVRGLESHITTLNSLNEWRFHERDENRAVFTFLHNTVHLEVKMKKASEKRFMYEDAEHDVDISFKFLLKGESSEPYAGMIHKLLGEYIQTQTKWMQKYPTTQHIPVLLHDISLVVSRLRLLGEEIHQLKKWGGLRLGILHITCVDTLVEILFSSVKTFAKFELSLAVTPDYPFSPLQMKRFQNHIGNTRADQIKDILSSVMPAKNYLKNIIQRIHAEIMG